MTTSPIKDVARDARIQLALEADENLAFIGAREGITWQRVQQIRDRLDYNKPDRRAKAIHSIVEAAFAPGITGYQDLQRERGHVYRTVREALRDAHMLEAAERLWESRREQQERHALVEKRATMLAKMRALGKRLNRTPSSADLNGRNSGTPSAAMYVHYFGSLRLAQAAAGFEPRGLGSHGHVKRRPKHGGKTFSNKK